MSDRLLAIKTVRSRDLSPDRFAGFSPYYKLIFCGQSSEYNLKTQSLKLLDYCEKASIQRSMSASTRSGISQGNKWAVFG